jgi:hypothetical protein
MGRNKGSAPWAWIHKDPFDHVRHNAWLKAKAQAAFRNEPWHLTIEDWFTIWTPELWQRRGRGTNDVCMVRIDTDLGFTVDNVKIVERYFQIIRGKQANQRPNEDRQI